MVITLFFWALQIFTTLDFSFMTLQYNLCPRLCLGDKLHWWAINEKSRAANICNARKNSVIAIFVLTAF